MNNDDRYEFRAFAKNFGAVESRLRSIASPDRIIESDEIYLVSTLTDTNNLKIRNGLLDIKALVEQNNRLEKWSPVLKTPLPISSRDTELQVLRALAITSGETGINHLDATTLIEQWARPHPHLRVAAVFKRRTIFTVSHCICELAEVSINGAWTMTACVESVDPELTLAACEELGLSCYRNENYLAAIKRVLGLNPFQGPLQYQS
jgi:hypothetical protein